MKSCRLQESNSGSTAFAGSVGARGGRGVQGIERRAAELPLVAWEGIRYDSLERLGMALDWSRCAAVESVPGKVSGAWVFRGTRIPAAAVFENLEDGLTIDQIVQMFDGLTREQVRAVLDFAAHSLETPAPAR